MQLSIPDLDLRHIYESGQCFRWEPLGQDTYRIPAFGRTLTVRQTDGVFDFSCGAGEFDAGAAGYLPGCPAGACRALSYRAPKLATSSLVGFLPMAIMPCINLGMGIPRKEFVQFTFLPVQTSNFEPCQGH